VLGDNPRFVVTNLPAKGSQAKIAPVHSGAHFTRRCTVRGRMEQCSRQQTLDLQADLMSTHYLASNQLRLWLAEPSPTC